MANKTQTIRIESILGGHSKLTAFAQPDQFMTSVGINPALGGTDDPDSGDGDPLGYIRPVGSSTIAGATINSEVLWMVAPPSGGSFGAGNYGGMAYYLYDAVGSVYTIDETWSTINGLGDLNDGGSASGNGSAYYDNYIYFARDTTVARYGPMDSSSRSFTDDYWVGTLGKTALINTVYPESFSSISEFPNHYLHRHSDGKLYIADVVGNQGTLHYIKTTKTTVEGDTDSGSTYDAINFGYKLYPTAIESYGTSIVIALFENMGQENGFLNARDSKTTAKIAFWDTTSLKANQIIWVEYPDQYISSIKNVNGNLYFFGGSINVPGYRVMQYIGGSSFVEVFSSVSVGLPLPGAVDSGPNLLAFGTNIAHPSGVGSTVLGLGINHPVLGNGIFSIATVPANATAVPSAILLIRNSNGYNFSPVVASAKPAVGYRITFPSGYTNADSFNRWFSQTYRIGQPFKILSIRLNFYDEIGASDILTVRVHRAGTPGGSTLVATIDQSYGTTRQGVVIRPNDLTCQSEFFLQLSWAGGASTPLIVSLPITIEYELLNIDARHNP